MNHICQVCGVSFHRRGSHVRYFCSMNCYATNRRRFEENFWNKVQKTEDCWLWTGNVLNKGMGYGRISFGKRRKEYAHRFSYRLHFGDIPKGLCVCHHCDNPICVRPDHLFTGTISENFKDMREKGRQVQVRGEQSAKAKLTSSDILLIRYLWRSGTKNQTQIAEIYKVTPVCINCIVNRKTWKHLL